MKKINQHLPAQQWFGGLAYLTIMTAALPQRVEFKVITSHED